MRRLLSPRQRAILEYVKLYHADNGYAPTLQEIGWACGLRSKATVAAHLAILERAGLVVKRPIHERQYWPAP